MSELEQAGYVERVPDPSDGRAKIIRLTERGQEAWTLGRSIIEEIRAGWEQRYGKERVANMIDLLDEIVGDDMWSTPALRRAA